jgi:hypothetical protein
MNKWSSYADYGPGTAYVTYSDVADKVHEVSVTEF